jgi:hypothetical protein
MNSKLFNSNPFVPMRWIGRFDMSKKASKMPQNDATMGLEGAKSVGQGQDSGPTPQNASTGVKTSASNYNPALALEVPSIDFGGGMQSAPVRLSLAPITPDNPKPS